MYTILWSNEYVWIGIEWENIDWITLGENTAGLLSWLLDATTMNWFCVTWPLVECKWTHEASNRKWIKP